MSDPQAHPVCRRCVLPANFPGADFDASNLCRYCREFAAAPSQTGQKQELGSRFESLLSQHRGRAGCYDLLMAYSGGKDSTYTLAQLRERYGLHILAVTFDNGFLSEQTRGNVYQVTEALAVDHLWFRPDPEILRRIFATCATESPYPAKALERASAICTSCIGLVKATFLRLAVEQDIPFLGFGWSPGQAPLSSALMANNPAFVRMTQAALLKPLAAMAGERVAAYFLSERHFASTRPFPINVHPLAFWDYDEAKIHAAIARLGWKAPSDTDTNSTNCRLNTLGNAVHRARYGFHPYAFELAKLVREGHLDREEALARLETPEDPAVLAEVRRRLGLA